MTFRTKIVFSIGLLGLLWFMLPNAARADAIYTYTGNPYTICGGAGSSIYTCNGTTPALSITFDIASPLGDDLNLRNITKNLISFTITDGTGLDITLANAEYEEFEISTNASGNITGWYINAYTPSSSAHPTFYTVTSDNYGGGDNEDYSETTVSTYKGKIGTAYTYGIGENEGTAIISENGPSAPGTWTTPSSVPEPSSLLLLGMGLLTLAGLSWRRKVTLPVA